MNSYVRPTVADYVGRLETRLRELGTGGELNILRSDAGVMTPEEAARNPVYGVLSGPSGGVAGALHVAKRAGFPDILTLHLGGSPAAGARDAARPVPDQDPVDRRAPRRRRRRLDRARAGAHEGAAGRPRVGGR